MGGVVAHKISETSQVLRLFLGLGLWTRACQFSIVSCLRVSCAHHEASAGVLAAECPSPAPGAGGDQGAGPGGGALTPKYREMRLGTGAAMHLHLSQLRANRGKVRTDFLFPQF